MKFRTLLLTLASFTSSVLAQSVTLSIGSGSGLAGSTVSLPISVASSGGALPVGLQWGLDISPSSGVASLSVVAGSSTTSSGKSLSCSGGNCLVFGFDPTVSIPDGVVATVNLVLSGTGQPFTVTLTGTSSSNGAGNGINTTGGSGSVSIIPPPAALNTLSCSPAAFSAAGTSTCTVTVTTTAGATVGLSENGSTVSVPSSVVIPTGQTSATFTATVSSVPANETVTITAALNSVTRTASLTLTSPPALSSLTCNQSSLGSGQSATCTATLNKNAPTATTVTLSDNTNRLTTPGSVTIASGQSSNTFQVTAGTISTSATATVTGSLNGTASAQIELVAANLSSVSCTPDTFSAAGTSLCTVTLSANAPSDTSVGLSENSSNVSVPASVTVPSGQSAAQFNATVSGAPADESVTITATLNSATRTDTLTLTPLPALTSITCVAGSLSSNQSTQCTALLNKAATAATIVTLSDNTAQLTTPANVVIASGQTSETFTVSTGTITAGQTATVSGVLNSVTRSAQISLVAPAALSSVTCTPNTFSASGFAACTVTLTAASSGSTEVGLSEVSSNVTIPDSVTVTNGQTSAPFTATVTAVPGDENVTITASLNAVTRTTSLALTTLPALSSISCGATSLNGSQSTACTATLSKAAAGNTTVALSDNSNQLTTPANVVVLNGQTSGQFTVTAGTIATSETVTVSGVLNGITRSAQINLAAPAGLSGLSCTPNSFSAAGTSNCTVTLVAAASSNTAVTLSDNSASVSVPANVTVLTGQTTAQFVATVGSFASDATATITATLNGGTQSASLTLTTVPALSSISCAPGSLNSSQSATCTATLTKASVGTTTVTLSDNSNQLSTPASVSLANGQVSNTFTVTTGTIATNETATVSGVLNSVTRSTQVTLTAQPVVLSSLSCSPSTLNASGFSGCTVTLVAAAPANTVVSLTDNSPNVTIPANVTVTSGQTSAQFTATITSLAADEMATITATVGSSTRSGTITLALPPALSSISCSSSSLNANQSTNCTATLNKVAAAPTVVTLSDSSNQLTTPASVTILAGQSSAAFTITAGTIATSETATVTGQMNSVSRTAQVSLAAPTGLSSLSCSPNSFGASGFAGCTVTLAGTAPSNTVVTLTDNSANITTPANVTVVSGQTSAQFTASITSVTADETATITASLGGGTQTATITLSVLPALSSIICPASLVSSQSANCTAVLNKAATVNAVVALSDSSSQLTTPATVTIPVGQTSAGFTIAAGMITTGETATVTGLLNSISRSAQVTLAGVAGLSNVICTPSSFSAAGSSVCSVTLSTAASANTVVTLGDNSLNVTIPENVTVLNGQSSAQFTASVGSVRADETVTVTASLGGITRTTEIVLALGSNPDAPLQLSCFPGTLVAGQSVLCEVTLAQPTADIAIVAISGNNDSVALPASVVLGSFEPSVQFRINAPATLANGTMRVTARTGEAAAAFTLTLQGPGFPQLTSLSCNPFSLAAGETALCTVTLDRGAPTAASIALVSNPEVLQAPSQVNIPAGSASGTFTAKVANLAAAQTTIINATYAGQQITTTLNLTGPAEQPSLQSFNCSPTSVPAGTSSFCTITFTGRIVFPAILAIAATSGPLQAPTQLMPAVGVTSVSFPIRAGSTDTDQEVVLGLTWSGSAPLSKTIRVTPQVEVSLKTPSVLFVRAGRPVSFDVQLERQSSFGAQVIAPSLPDGASFRNMRFSWTPDSDKVGEHFIEIRANDNGGSSVTAIVRVVVRAAEATVDALVNPAGFSLSGLCSANSVMTLLGSGFSLRDPEHAGVPLPTILGGVRVRINGAYAPLLHVQDDLIHFQCPDLPADAELDIVLEYESVPPPNGSGQRDSTLTVTPIRAKMSAATPGIYVIGGSQGAVLESASGLIAADPNPDFPSRPAAPGDFLVIYGNGMGDGTQAVGAGEAAPLDPLVQSTATVMVDFGDGIKVPAAFAGLAPGYIGLFQVNVQIPSGTQLGSAVPLTIEMQWPGRPSLRSNTVTVAIQPR